MAIETDVAARAGERRPHPDLHNDDLAPVASGQRRWGWFEIFNVWTNDVQSLAGYTLAATLFVTAGINGWYVFAAIVLAGLIVNWLVNLSGTPSVRHGVPYAVMARTSMGARGARFPALVRGVVAAMQVAIFARGISWIGRFLNVAGPAVYVVMIALLIAIWVEAGDRLLPAVRSIFAGEAVTGWAAVGAFVGVVGTMIAYFALFSMDPDAAYHYTHGWNLRALVAVGGAAVFSVLTVWVPALVALSGFAWVIGALLGGVFYLVAMRTMPARAAS
ncbi:cytosine permease [Georgenia deserti]|uniref:Cytosine permease n=1 Tax=Georgenia deserti TaxID=2093781 RepID=A0ABW4L4M7_9MICO